MSPLARSFQTMTMAMQRAKPNRISPTMYSGLVAQEDDGQREHQDRPDDPVLDQRKPKHFPFFGKCWGFL